MDTTRSPLTSGPIFKPLLRFMLPVMLAALLQAMYGAVDLIVIGRFESPEIVQSATAAVGTGSMIMTLLTYVISGLTMGATVTLGTRIGAQDSEGAGRTVGSAVCIFAVFAIVMTVLLYVCAPLFARLMNAPSVELTVQYLRICALGILFITAYNAVSGLFRGIGNSKLPLVFVAVACVVNIVLDLLTVCVFHMGVAGVALATIAAQAVSVILSLLTIHRIQLPFIFSRKMLRPWKPETGRILVAGIPLALQDFLTNLSFIVINAAANRLGPNAALWPAIAAGYSVDNKLTTFMMIPPVAFLQSMSVFVAQNRGAGRPERIRKGLHFMSASALCAGALLALLCFFGGRAMAGIFTTDADTIAYAAEYLRGFAADMLIGCLLLMMLGYFNGSGHSGFVMVQGLVGAFAVRIPVVLLLAKWDRVRLFHLGLGCAAASYASLLLCLAFYCRLNRKKRM